MTAALAPAMMAKAEGIAATILKESRQEIVKLRFNEDLDVVGPDEHAVFSLTVTPALIGTIGAIGVAILIISRLAASGVGSWAEEKAKQGQYRPWWWPKSWG